MLIYGYIQRFTVWCAFGLMELLVRTSLNKASLNAFIKHKRHQMRIEEPILLHYFKETFEQKLKKIGELYTRMYTRFVCISCYVIHALDEHVIIIFFSLLFSHFLLYPKLNANFHYLNEMYFNEVYFNFYNHGSFQLENVPIRHSHKLIFFLNRMFIIHNVMHACPSFVLLITHWNQSLYDDWSSTGLSYIEIAGDRGIKRNNCYVDCVFAIIGFLCCCNRNLE